MKKTLMFIGVVLTFGFIHAVAAEEETDLRIVSLMPSNTEIVDLLGLTEALVAVTIHDNYPDDLEDLDIERLDTFELDVETLIELEPTHILAHSASFSTMEEILEDVHEATGAEIINVRDALSYEDISISIAELGEVLDKRTPAEEAINAFEAELASLIEDTELDETSVAVVVSLDPDIYVVGEETFIASLLELIDINNVFDDIGGYQAIDVENLLERDPEYVLSIAGLDEEELQEQLSDLSLDDALISESKRQCVIDPDLLSRPTPRVVEGLQAVIDCLDE